MDTTCQTKTRYRTRPGQGYPIGATAGAEGVNFAVYSRHAEAVFLLLFDDPAGEPTDIVRLEERTRHVWHVFVEGVRPGQLYAYKADGPFRPAEGLRFNPNKVLLDPYAKAVSGKFRNRDNLLLAYDPSSPEQDLSRDNRGNFALVPKGIVVDDAFDWQGDAPPAIPFERLLVYEVHVKGFTAHASSGVRFPGTYLGFIEKIPHLQELGVNAVELLPVHEYVVDDFLNRRGLTNYWGYNSIGFFAPESGYAARPGEQVKEFKTLVRALHRAGIEVILDVVYNHTGEGNEMGPTLSLKGLDNPSYYALTGPPDQPGRYYMNFTGCGNSLNLSDIGGLRLVMDSLRYWVQVMHVDGFRFDLASVLGRDGERWSFDRAAGFFDAIAQDPVLNRVKLIAEPWDIGTYQVGNFPVDWSEWNGRFRDSFRRFLKGDAGLLPEVGRRFTGSADLFGDDGRSAYNSVNFVTCHDGFTLADLVSYNGKHNEANGEDNRDGSDDNHSWNCGEEGPATRPETAALRRQMVKNHLAALLFSSGTPMLLGGDEFFRSQGGNNNAYCQDNALSWFDWGLLEKNRDVFDFTRRLISTVKAHPILQRRKFFVGEDLDCDGLPDLSWFGPGLQSPRWGYPECRTLGILLDGGEVPSAWGNYCLYIIFNSGWNLQAFRLPDPGAGRTWRRAMDTSLPAGQDIVDAGQEVPLDPGGEYLTNPRSTVLLVAR